ncbi:FliO/MopB family protein [Sanguibacter suaedae]|uniref:Flagellar biosynthetic protein FliO n=1 Tax=Sanguibacter suaedae TaxID=2795737 RepID=A0A934IB79_9MICO|nr:flagellar biosynthetic protein FliO [Sanguibacter suaedae]MBI9114585.1 flagellar biosynthetic protein FliO [Sanguibacter suaedae]
MDTAVVVLRAALSLAAVLGLIWYAGRRLSDTSASERGDGPLGRLLTRSGLRPASRRTARGLRTPGVTMAVVGRQVLGPRASVAVLDVGDQRLVLGVTDAGVNVLSTQAVPAAEEVPDELPAGEVREEIDVTAALTLVKALPEETEDAGTGVASPATAAPVPAAAPAAGGGALDGSVLSPATWRQALTVMQSRTVRR